MLTMNHGSVRMVGRYRPNSRLSANANTWPHAYGRATMMQMTKANAELCDRVIRAIGCNTDPLDALNALADALGFQLSLITCQYCRAEAARAFTQVIPNVLAHANEVASECAAACGDAVDRPHAHLSH